MTTRPTSFDVAAMAGVSQATVSRVLNDSALVSARARRRVMDAAQTLNYKVDANARKLRSKKVHTIEILVVEEVNNECGVINPFFVPMIAEIIKYAGQIGYETVVSLQPENQTGAPYSCISRPASGIIFLAPKEFETYARTARSPNAADDHWVVWGRYCTDVNTACVVSDNEAGAFDAVRHLIALGRKRIAYLGKFSGEQWEFIERHKGYCDALKAAGLLREDGLQVDCVLNMAGGAEAVSRLIEAGVQFDAIFAATDVLGIGAMRELTARGISIPGEVAVIGFDDLWICNTVTPRLSTVRQDTGAAARVLVDSVAALIEGEVAATTKIPTELVIRESCGGKRANLG